MEESANFIPLGLGKERRGSISKAPQDVPTSISARNISTSVSARRASIGPSILDGPKIIGATLAERKAIAKEYRLAAKRVKKKAKADAKRARKENAILHRRMTRNNEKYTKNKDRNRERDILLERQRLRFEAVRQAERLAAIHDPTGKMFNVGEVIVMPDGQVKSKETIAKAAEAKKQREIEAAAEKLENARLTEEKAKYREAKIQAKREGRDPPSRPDYVPQVNLQSAASFYGNGNGGQPAYSGQQMGRPQTNGGVNPNRKISKKQQQRQEMLKPKPVPPKPVIPEGIPLPEGEENLLALWDITDEAIVRRLNSKKKEKSLAAKQLRLVQKEQKKFNRAMKVRKKQAANAGVLWDAEKAKKEILGEMEKADWEENSSESDSDSDSESDSESESKAETNGKNGKKASSNDNDDSDSTSSSDSSSDSDSDTDSDAEAGEEKDTPKKKKNGMPNVNRPRLDLGLLEQAAKIKQAHEEKKRNARLKRRAEWREQAAQEQAKKEAETEAARVEAEKAEIAKLEEAAKEKPAKEKSSKKRKRSSEDEAEQTGKKPKTEDEESGEEAKRKAERKRRRKEEKRAKEAELLASKTEVVESKDDKLDQAIAKREAKLREENRETEEAPQNAKVATNWNPDALSGDEQRKEKYLRLLGAKKDSKTSKNVKAETDKQKAAREKQEKLAVKVVQPDSIERKEKKREKRAARKAEEEAAAAAAKSEQLARMQSDLEKQYEAGMKLKHDGGSKRRGLGA